MATFLETLTTMLKNSLAGDPPPPALLQGLENRLNDLLAVSVDPSGDGIDRWLTRFKELANDETLRETLVVWALQMQFPRLAEALTLIGIIGVEFEQDAPRAFSINWNGFNNLLKDPGTQALNLLLSHVQNLNDLKALQALCLMLIAAPQELLKLEYARQGFASLPLSGDPGVSLQELLALINSPLRLPLPFTSPLTFEQFKTLAQQPAGALGSLALVGPDALMQPSLDGFGIEAQISDVQLATTKRVELGNGWQVIFASADNGAKTYRFQFSGNALDQAARPTASSVCCSARRWLALRRCWRACSMARRWTFCLATNCAFGCCPTACCCGC